MKVAKRETDHKESTSIQVTHDEGSKPQQALSDNVKARHDSAQSARLRLAMVRVAANVCGDRFICW